MRVVVLVPRRAGMADRDRLWEFARRWWENDHPAWDIVEGHHDEDEGPFNRSMAINRAAAAAGDWDVAVIIDADVLCDAGVVSAAADMAFASNRMVLGYHDRVLLSPKGTEKVLAGFSGNWRQPGFTAGSYADACSSCVVVSRTLWDLVDGFDEAFVGWGWEDVAFRIACETMSGGPMVKLAAECWHLHHKVSGGNNPREATFIANRARGERYKAAHWKPDAIRALRAAPATALSGPTRIPRILHRTVPPATSDEVESLWRGFETWHPGWQLLTHRDPLDPNEWPETSWVWEKCTSGAQFAGLVRLEAIWRFGGVYVDSDVQCYRSFEPLLALPAFAAWEDAKVVPDAVFGAEPNHPAVRAMLDRACIAVSEGKGAWDSGPGVFTQILPGRDDVLLLPPGAFYPVHYSQKAAIAGHTPEPWSFGIHLWHASWLPADKRR